MNIIETVLGWRRDAKGLLHSARELIATRHHETDGPSRKLGRANGGQDGSVNARPSAVAETEDNTFWQLSRQHESLAALIADRTHDPYHPDYQPHAVRNYPGALFNGNARSTNPAFIDLSQRIEARDRPSGARDQSSGVWDRPLAEALIEALSVDDAVQVFERLAVLEGAVTDLAAARDPRQPATQYLRLDRALFLYWLARRAKPSKIVQCGAYSGLSASFLMLALAKNGGEGTLTVIDPAFPYHQRIYGPITGYALIPEGKTTAWMLPDAHRDRLTIRNGDATDLPDIIGQLDAIDVFCYGTDPIYQHALVAFQAAYHKLTAGGLVIAEHVPWHGAVWDFADSLGVPSYNFKGQIGVAFL